MRFALAEHPPASDEEWDLAVSDPVVTEPTTGYLSVINIADDDLPIAVVTLIDFRQVGVDIGSGLQASPRELVPAQKEHVYRMEFAEPVSDQESDVVQLMIWDPEVASAAENRSLTVNALFSAARIPLSDSVGHESVAASLPLVEMRSVEGPPDFGGVIANRLVDDPGPLWTNEDTEKEERIDFFVHVMNPGDESLDVILVGLVEWEQVPLWPGGQVAARVRVPPGSVSSVPAVLTAPAAAGSYQFQVFTIPTDPSRVADHEAPNAGVVAGARVLLRVE